MFSLALLFFSGFGIMVQMAASNTILQTIVDDDKRGRIMSFYTMAFMGMAPFGSLFSGMLASRIGVSNTLIISGSCCILAAIMFAFNLPSLRKTVRPIYVKMGIVSEIEMEG
jgi:MFS family permease